MIAVLAAIFTIAVSGLPLTLAIDRTARGTLLVGLAFLYGSANVMFALMLLTTLKAPWSTLNALAVLLAAASAGMIIMTRQAPDSRIGPAFKMHALDGGTAILGFSFLTFAAIASPWKWDFWTIWGLKARVFLDFNGIDWSWLERRWNDFSHPDYPLLVTLNYDFAGLLAGGWSDRWLGLFCVAWAGAALLVIRALAAEEAPPWAAAVATLSVASIAMSLQIGLAEGALIAFSGCALLFLRSAISDQPTADRDWRHGALLLGLAANCKNEGLAFIATSAVAIIVADPGRWRRVLRLWPSVAIIAPWLLLRTTHALQTDVTSGNLLDRAVEHSSQAGEAFKLLRGSLVDPWLWVVIVITFIIIPRALYRERFIVGVTFLQMSTYIAVYLVTPKDLMWHIAHSWDRLTRNLELPITFVSALLLANFVAGRSSDPVEPIDDSD